MHITLPVPYLLWPTHIPIIRPNIKRLNSHALYFPALMLRWQEEFLNAHLSHILYMQLPSFHMTASPFLHAPHSIDPLYMGANYPTFIYRPHTVGPIACLLHAYHPTGPLFIVAIPL